MIIEVINQPSYLGGPTLYHLFLLEVPKMREPKLSSNIGHVLFGNQSCECVVPQGWETAVFRHCLTIWISFGNIQFGQLKNCHNLWHGIFFAWFTAWTSHLFAISLVAVAQRFTAMRQNHWILHTIARAHEGLRAACASPRWVLVAWKVGDQP